MGGVPGPSGPQLISGRGDQVSAVSFHSRKALTGSCLTPSFRNWFLAASWGWDSTRECLSPVSQPHSGEQTPRAFGRHLGSSHPCSPWRACPDNLAHLCGLHCPPPTSLPSTPTHFGSSEPRTGQQVCQTSQPSGPTRAHPLRGPQGRAGGLGEAPLSAWPPRESWTEKSAFHHDRPQRSLRP